MKDQITGADLKDPVWVLSSNKIICINRETATKEGLEPLDIRVNANISSTNAREDEQKIIAEPTSYKAPKIAKVQFVGDMGVGKSSLVHHVDTHGNPTGLNFSHYDIPSLNVKGQFWDSVATKDGFVDAFNKGCNVFVLLYDVANEESFNNIEKVWLKLTQQYGKEIPIILVGTKSDLVDEKQVSDERAERLANTLNAPFLLVSVRENKNVNELYELAANLFLDPKYYIKKSNAEAKAKQDEAEVQDYITTLSKKDDEREWCVFGYTKKQKLAAAIALLGFLQHPNNKKLKEVLDTDVIKKPLNQGTLGSISKKHTKP